MRDLSGLLPIMWSPALQAGADVVKGIATPIIGGVVTSTLLELLIYPIIFLMWRGQKVGEASRCLVADVGLGDMGVFLVVVLIVVTAKLLRK